MPTLRKRQSTVQAQLDALENELHDAESYLKLADTLEGFLTRLNDGLDRLSLEEQQRILRLVVREVLIGGGDETITIRHSIPTPNGGPNGGYPLRGSSHAASSLIGAVASARKLADYGVSRCGPRYRKVTSRTLSWPSSCINRRVSPKPKPPCGGAPKRKKSR